MTVASLMDALRECIEHGLDPNSPVQGYNGDSQGYEEITGFIYGGDAEINPLILQTD